MKFRDILRTANSNLWRSKLRTILTMSAVFIGTLTLMLTTGVGSGLKTYVQEQVDAAGAKDQLFVSVKTEGGGPMSNDKATEYDPNKQQGSPDFSNMPTLSTEDVEKIGKTAGILEVVPGYPIAVEYIARNNKQFVGFITQGLEGLQIPIAAGRAVDENGKDYEITLAPAFVEPLGFANEEAAVGQTVQLAFKDANGAIFTLDTKVVGVQEKTIIQGNAMVMNTAVTEAAFLRATEGLSDFQRFQYPMVFARFDINSSDQELTDLKKRLEDQGYSASTLDDSLGIITSIIDGITTFLNIFAGIALAAATFGIVNTLLMAVQERTREIGLMKALGMGRRKIFGLFSLEAILIGFWGALLALGAANIIGRVGSNIAGNTIFKDFEGLELFSFPADSMIGIILLIMTIAFIAATLPARRASKLDPIEALRYE